MISRKWSGSDLVAMKLIMIPLTMILLSSVVFSPAAASENYDTTYGKMDPLGDINIYIMPSAYQIHGIENVSYQFTLANSAKSVISVEASADAGSFSRDIITIKGYTVEAIWLNMTATHAGSYTATFRNDKNITRIPFWVEVAEVADTPTQIEPDLNISQTSSDISEFRYSAINKVGFMRRAPLTLINLTDDDGFWVSFTPASRITDTEVLLNAFVATTTDYTTRYEIVSNNLVKNIITIGRPMHIDEYMHYSGDVRPHLSPDGSIEFSRRVSWSSPSFILRAPLAADSNN